MNRWRAPGDDPVMMAGLQLAWLHPRIPPHYIRDLETERARLLREES